jgi:hypothetical protein
MTKRRVVFPAGIGLRDPRSQKRDLGHPSVSTSDIAEGTIFVISLPTRDDNGESGSYLRLVADPAGRHDLPGA